MHCLVLGKLVDFCNLNVVLNFVISLVEVHPNSVFYWIAGKETEAPQISVPYFESPRNSSYNVFYSLFTWKIILDASTLIPGL